ncbi:MAG: hypothetical protein EBT81_03535 [Gammaproteobacteria bacterium]|nr:hypothetical protein [Gammaproteobacteria bacterium]
MHTQTRRSIHSVYQRFKTLSFWVLSLWVSTLWLVVVPVTIAAPVAVSTPDRSAEFAELAQLFSGRYSGVVADPTDPTAQRRISLYHKIVRIDWSALGEYVYYHQISLDGFDSKKPWQQKIYVFDQDPARKQDAMRAFVVPPSLELANLEADPVKLGRLTKASSPTAAGLQGFEAGCEFRWSRAAQGVFTARVRKRDCSYDSTAFKQKISPESFASRRMAQSRSGAHGLHGSRCGKSHFRAVTCFRAAACGESARPHSHRLVRGSQHQSGSGQLRDSVGRPRRQKDHRRCRGTGTAGIRARVDRRHQIRFLGRRRRVRAAGGLRRRILGRGGS